jgi:hypothetical protein
MYKIIAALVLALCFLAGGYYWGSGNVIVEKGETVTVIKDRIITKTITRKPDGTIIETVKEEEHDSSQTNTTVSTKPGPENKANYRIGAAYWVRSTADVLRPEKPYDGISLSVSRRIAGPAWVDVLAKPFGVRREVALGVSVQW